MVLLHGLDDNNRQISKKPIYIKPHDIEFRFQINKSMIDLWDSDEKVEDFTRSLYQELMELKFKIHEFRFSSPPFFFSFLLEKLRFGEDPSFDKIVRDGGQKSRFL